VTGGGPSIDQDARNQKPSSSDHWVVGSVSVSRACLRRQRDDGQDGCHLFGKGVSGRFIWGLVSSSTTRR
jgi:hypothetical protein